MLRVFILFLCCINIFAQENSNQEYRATTQKINNLVHTDLVITPDFSKSYLYGKAIISLQPNFYPTDSLTLDAKGMEIKEIAILNNGKKTKLNYKYDSLQLFINLDKIYTKEQPYTIFIDYIARPNEVKQKGSQAITDAKGMYFINPLGEEKNKPTQIWTQGETESNSCWFPTIDKPNQKMTNRITVTVPQKFVTLSNGFLEKQTNNADSTRTDIWYMDLPHAPYLVFLGVGDFSIVKDYYKNKEVSYYVEPSYQKVARKIFGNTPEMISFYSKTLGVDFPWQKYAQMVGRDYVSGAMENTTATLHQESAQQSERDLIDGNGWESTIAHELFHQWFGDLVTAESWSNITLNESFATYGSYLWDEYKYGKNKADETLFYDHQSYKSGGESSRKKHLVRYYYDNKEDVFDNISYPKGAAILHMLRKYLGDSAFFESLKLYLTNNKFKSAEVSQLRLAFEQISGEDLNWYFNQWYFNNGHPTLLIKDSIDTKNKKLILTFNQTQKEESFKLPIPVWIFDKNKNLQKHIFWNTSRKDTFFIPFQEKPIFYIVDPERYILSDFIEYSKTKTDYLFQIQSIPFYISKRDAIQKIMKQIDSNTLKSKDTVFYALFKNFINSDQYIQEVYLNAFNRNRIKLKKEQEKLILSISKDKSKPSSLRALSIEYLGNINYKTYKEEFKTLAKDSSYKVSGAALLLLSKDSTQQSFVDNILKNWIQHKDNSTTAEYILTELYIQKSDTNSLNYLINTFTSSNQKRIVYNITSVFLRKIFTPETNFYTFKKIIDALVEKINQKNLIIKEQILMYFEMAKNTLQETIKDKKSNVLDFEQKIQYIDFISNKLST